MKRFAAAFLSIAVALLIIAAGNGAGTRPQGLPLGCFRASVRDVFQNDDAIVSQIEIETRPGLFVEVVSDIPNKGGVGVRSGSALPDGSTPLLRLTIIGDHVKTTSGSAVKFVMDLTALGHRATFSKSDRAPVKLKLADIFSMNLKTGVHREGAPTKLVTFEGVTYSLVVEER